MPLRVVLEVAPGKAFAIAIDWPGWSRGAKTADEALEALLGHAPRYARVATRAKLAFDPPATARGVDVVERLAGSSGTEFGVPSVEADADREPVSPADLRRLTALLEASWAGFDAAARAAQGVTLSVGPRGGGRSREKMIGHVLEAELAYLGQLGSRPPARPTAADEALVVVRAAFLATLRARVADEPVPNPRKTLRPWSPRYAVRRSAWHALDHAWELEDRSTRS
jgi:hypothetical protein